MQAVVYFETNANLYQMPIVLQTYTCNQKY